MKLSTVLFFFLLQTFICWKNGLSQREIKKELSNELIINGRLDNMTEPVEYIYASILDGAGPDSVKVINNRYTIKTKIAAPSFITLYSKNPANPDNLKNKYMFSFVSEATSLKVNSNNSLSNSTVTGSKTYLQFIALERKREIPAGKLQQLYKRLAEKKAKGDSLTVAKLNDSIVLLRQEISNLFFENAVAYPSSTIAGYTLNMYLSISPDVMTDERIDTLESIFNKLAHGLQTSYYGKRIRKRIDSYKMNIGMAAPDFIQNDTSGKAVSLTEFRGNYVLLDFWASWCIPCRNQNPDLVRIFDKYKNKGLEIIGISLDKPEDRAKWIKAINDDKLTWIHVSDLKYWDNQVARLYKVAEIPRNFLIDPSGKIIDKNLDGKRLSDKMAELFNR